MKKILSFFLSMIAIFTLVSCGSSKLTQNTDGLKNVVEQALPAKSDKFMSADYPAPKNVPAGMKFAGWFNTSIGQSVFEKSPLKDGDYINPQGKVYPYFIPVNYKTFNWDKGSTNFNASLQVYYQNPLNPFTSRDNSITNIIDLTNLQPFRVVPNWRKAIKDGLAKYPGDFSQFSAENSPASFNNLDKLYVLDGLASFPKDQNGDEHLNEYGEFDQKKAADITDTVWTYELKPDLKFYGTNTPINASTYEFSLKTALDPKQNNELGLRFYQDDTNRNGNPILNTKEYLKGKATWDQVGFKVDSNNPLKFSITFSKPVSQYTALGTVSEFYLVEPAVYQKSLNSDGSKSSYGTTPDLYSNSGDYILKEFNNKSKIVLNKNFDSRLAYLSSYNSIQTTLVADANAILTEFTDGNSTAIGVNKLNKDKLSPWQSTTVDQLGESARLLIFNLTKSTAKTDKVVSDPIMGNKDFRRALLFAVNRKELAEGAAYPGQPVAIPVSNDDVQYLTNKLSYAKSDYHKQVLQQYNLNPDNPGYAPDQAKSLLQKAYQALKYPDNKVITLVVVRPDDEIWKGTFQEIQKSFKEVFNGKIVLEDRPLSGQASKNATKTYNWDLLLTGLSANTYYNILWQLPTINFDGSNAGASSLGINGPIDNYSSLPADEDGNRLAEFTKDTFTVSLPNGFKYLKSKIENPESEYYNVDGTLKDTYKDNKTLYDLLKPTQGINAKLTYMQILKTIIENDETIYGPVSNYPKADGFEDEAYQITQIFDKLFFDYVPTMGLFTNAGKVAYKPNVGNIWPKVSLRWDWGIGAYRFLTTSFYFVQFYNEDPKKSIEEILKATAAPKFDLNLQLPEGFTAVSVDDKSASLKGNVLSTYQGNTVRLLFQSTDPSKSINQLTFNGRTINPIAHNQFIFVADNKSDVVAVSADTTYDLSKLPASLKADKQSVKYNEPVTITVTVPEGAKLYKLTLGSKDLASQVNAQNQLVIDHLTQEPLFQVTFITEINISDKWAPVLSGKVVTLEGKKYIAYDSVVAFKRTLDLADAAKLYSETVEGQKLLPVQDAPDGEAPYLLYSYTYDAGKAEGTQVLKSAVLTLVIRGKYDHAITVTDDQPVDVTTIQTISDEDNFKVQFADGTRLSLFEGVNATDPSQEFPADKADTAVFAGVGQSVKFTVDVTPNFIVKSVSYNGTVLKGVANEDKVLEYTITVAQGAGIVVAVEESQAHKDLVAALKGKFSSESAIVAKERSIAGLVAGVYALLGDKASETYTVKIASPKDGKATVIIGSKATGAFVTFTEVAYSFA